MGLYVPQLNFRDVRRGEIIEIHDEDLPQWQKFIDKGYLKPHEPYVILGNFVKPEDVAPKTKSVSEPQQDLHSVEANASPEPEALDPDDESDVIDAELVDDEDFVLVPVDDEPEDGD